MKEKERLRELEEQIIKGANARYPPKIITTCPFCFAKLIGTDIPLKCPHCNTNFDENDDLQLIEKKSWMDKALKVKVRL